MPEIQIPRCLMVPVFLGLGFLIFGLQSQAFNPPVDEGQGFSAEIHVAKRIEINGFPVPASVEIRNHRSHSASVVARLQGIDGWKTVRLSESGAPLHSQELPEVTIEAGQSAIIGYQFEPARDSYSAHYPLHAYVNIKTVTEQVDLHPIAIVELKVHESPTDRLAASVANVRPERPFLLMQQKGFSFEIEPDNGEIHDMPAGWTGIDSETHGILSVQPLIHRLPKAKPALAIHPPWKQGPGKARVVWTLQLPTTKPITLGASLAIRDNRPDEPKSDGVTFRVLANGALLFEQHTDTKRWEDARVDLSLFAGKEIRLALESDVGPNRDPTCDQSYWAQPWIYAGRLPPTGERAEETISIANRMEQAKKVLAEAMETCGAGTQKPQSLVRDKVRVTLFGENEEVFGFAIVPGSHGILDAACAVASARDSVAFEGFTLRLEDKDPLEFLSGFQIGPSIYEQNRWRTELVKEEKKHWVSLEVIPHDGGIELKWNSDLQMTDLTTGRFDREAPEVYAGVGNVIRDPLAPFELHADGHHLSTRHIGLRFGDALSLLVACSNPPDRFSVNPVDRNYALHSHQEGSFYIVPSSRSAFDAVSKYRRLVRFPRAPGVARLAGRFTFDLWGGTYRETANKLEMAAKYGLTDSVVVFHAWQRWGYDYRLPDIYPPNPRLGSLEDFKTLREVCGKHEILFAPHDNYIDFYPDAEGFSYDHICFDSSGNPVKGWMNFGRDAQAYRFRPDTYLSFLERNLNLLEESIQPDGYFVDVFSSMGAFDYRDRDGGFHSAVETIECWGAGFDRIREILGGNAVQISESGTDLLLGHLDGAQCNHLRVTQEGTAFSWRVHCKDNERIPWQDLAMHDVFILQGAGYPHRYNSGQDPYRHGINSDDYLSMEVLTGHAPMVSEAFSRAVVRKYWLLHPFLEEVAGVPMKGAAFIEGDIHRQTVDYENGARVWVNRGKDDWTIENGHVLPPFGFWAEGPKTRAGVVKIAGRTVESSSGPGFRYADAREVDCQELVPLTVSLVEFSPIDKEKSEYSMKLEWKVMGEMPEGYHPFVHFTVPGPYGYDKIIFRAKGPFPRLTEFSGPLFKHALKVVVPASLEDRTYTMRAGIWNPKKHKRRMLSNRRDPFGTAPLGELDVSANNSVVLCKPAHARPEMAGTDLSEPVDFGWCKTAVGVKARKDRDSIWITPLPDGKTALFHLRIDPNAGKSTPAARSSQGPRCASVEVFAESFDGKIVAVEVDRAAGYLSWNLKPDFFRYRVSGSGVAAVEITDPDFKIRFRGSSRVW